MISLIESEKHHKVENITKMEAHRYREQSTGYQQGGDERRAIQRWGSGRLTVLGVRGAQGCIVQHGE